MQFPSPAILALSVLILVRLPEALLFAGPVSQPQAAASDAETHYRNGMLLKQAGKSDEAVAEFEQAIESDPTFQKACDAVDEILNRRREWDRVIACWNRVIAAQPNAHAYRERAGAYSQKHDPDNALSDAERACSLGDQTCCQYAARLRQAAAAKAADQQLQPPQEASRPAEPVPAPSEQKSKRYYWWKEAIATALSSLLVAYVLRWLARFRKRPKCKLLSEPEQDEVVSEFQERRSRFLRSGLLPAGIGMGLLMAGMMSVDHAKFLGTVAIVAGFILFTKGVFYTLDEYKCPMCDETPKGRGGGVIINPDKCPNCGVRLR